MKLIDFCSIRNIQTQTVGKYIDRHPELFDGHISKVGKQSVLDETAEAILAEMYPIKPVEVSKEHLELIKKLDSYQQLVIQLQQEIIQKDKILLETQNNLNLLEYKTQELEELKEESKKLEASIFDLEKNNQDLLKELDRLKNRNLFERLFNK